MLYECHIDAIQVPCKCDTGANTMRMTYKGGVVRLDGEE